MPRDVDNVLLMRVGYGGDFISVTYLKDGNKHEQHRFTNLDCWSDDNTYHFQIDPEDRWAYVMTGE